MPHVQTPVTPADKLAFLDFRRYETYLRDVIEPAVYPESEAIEAGVCVLADPKAEVMKPGVNGFDPSKLAYAPVKPVWSWGPKWSTAWFRVRGNVPKSFAGRKAVLRFSSGTEGQIWTRVSGGRGFEPRQGLDVNRDAFAIVEGEVKGGEAFEVFVEAACNHPFGAGGFEWDGSEVHARWNSETPGRFERCEIAVRDEAAWELRQLYAFSVGLMAELAFDSTRFNELRAALRVATNAHPGRAKLAAEVLAAALKSPAAGSATRCMAVGHAHLDTAWLWPIRETRRKLIRTFTNQLGLMERFPEYRFLASQAQHYAWIEEDAPEVFEQIKRRVAEGRWEPGGAMWVEPDVNCVSGESLVRQILHGTRYWESKFGERGKQSFLFLPDTFGFGANLPQIMHLAGLDTFITNKLHWWQHTTFPHTTFVWRGIDGTQVLAHNTPGQDYNATNQPKELRRGEVTHRNKDLRPAGPASKEPRASASESAPLWLQPFGFGDGGGGATDWSIRYGELAANCDGLPRVEFARADDFCKALGDQQLDRANFPEWFGELDMEIHRGTLTSQAWIKRANRQAEENLRLAEILLCSSPAPSGGGVASLRGDGGGVSQDRTALDRAWKLTLLNQFHDILPGSSIGWVYEDAKKDHAEIQRLIAPIIERGLAEAATRVAGPAVFNPSSRAFTGVVDVDGTPMFASEVPALGVGTASSELPAGVAPVEVDQLVYSLSNSMVDVWPNAHDRMEMTVMAKRADGTLRFRANLQYRIYEDRPIMWDAWDIDHHYPEKLVSELSFDDMEIVESSPLRSVIEVRRELDAGCAMTVRIVVTAGSPRIDLHHRVEWRNRHQLLRLHVSTDVGNTGVCSHGTHFGHLSRPTHRNTGHERARFEFPVQGWLDVSEQGSGISVLTNSKFGLSCAQGSGGIEAGVSLLRGSTWPDPEADQGVHEFTVSLMPHAGDWRAAGVVHQSELLRSPPRACGRTGILPVSGMGFQPMSLPSLTPATAPQGEGRQNHGQDAHATLKIRQGAYLPHWTKEGSTYSVTFRLADSLPREVLQGFLAEREGIVKRAKAMGRGLTDFELQRLDELHSDRIEKYLDAGHGVCHMNDDRIAALVEGALKHFDGTRYDLYAWAVMPNHTHAVFRPKDPHAVSEILHSWKSFTGNEANKILGKPKSGEAFWQAEYYDHLVRDAQDFEHCIRYVLENPVTAGLRDWKWSGRGKALSGMGSQPMSPRGTGILPVSSGGTGILPVSSGGTGILPVSSGGTGILPVSSASAGSPIPKNHGLEAHATWAPFTISTTGHAAVQVSAFKPAEDGDDLILRVFESNGGGGKVSVNWNVPVADVQGVDLLERKTQSNWKVFSHSNDETTEEVLPFKSVDTFGAISTFSIRPFEIVTLRITRP